MELYIFSICIFYESEINEWVTILLLRNQRPTCNLQESDTLHKYLKSEVRNRQNIDL